MYRYLAALLITPALSLAQLPFSRNPQPDLNQQIATYTKPSVVRIVDGCSGKFHYENPSNRKNYYEDDASYGSLGSGYFINPDGYIVTNAHVVELANKDDKGDRQGEKECKDRLSEQFAKKAAEYFNKKPNDLNVISFFKDNSNPIPGTFERIQLVVLPHKDSTALQFEVKSFGKPTKGNSPEGKDVAIIKIAIKNAPVLQLSSEEVTYQEHITVLGYPSAADIWTKESVTEASIIDGKVANPHKTLSSGAPVLQLNVSVTQGISGGPVVNDKGELIGMVTFLTGKNVDEPVGIPFAIPATTIREFIGPAGTTNRSGEIDSLYREGLQLYWQGNYRSAKIRLEAVKSLFPQHSEAERLIGECDREMVKERDGSHYIFWLAVITGVGLLSLVYFLLQRKSSQKSTPSIPQGVARGDESASNISYQGNGSGTQTWLELENQGQFRRFHLQKDVHQLGRDPAWSDLVLPTSWEVISRRHAILRKEGDDYRIYDGDGTTPSRNGLLIDDSNRVDPIDGYPLKNGVQLKIGKEPHEQILLTYFNPASTQSVARPTKMAE